VRRGIREVRVRGEENYRAEGVRSPSVISDTFGSTLSLSDLVSITQLFSNLQHTLMASGFLGDIFEMWRNCNWGAFSRAFLLLLSCEFELSYVYCLCNIIYLRE
jgi:hypothetical protein